ncbi:MAG: rhodanese-like domain-containing protein [Hymenobacter sp.]
MEDLKNQEVIVHCKSGARSSAAKAFLTQQGFTNVRNLEGGILACRRAPVIAALRSMTDAYPPTPGTYRLLCSFTADCGRRGFW